VEGLLAARMVSNMVILRAELNYSRNVKRRNTRKIFRELRAEGRSGNAMPWSRTGNVGRGVAEEQISRLGLIQGLAFVSVLSRWRDLLAISGRAV
jgi:hypothetical protein